MKFHLAILSILFSTSVFAQNYNLTGTATASGGDCYTITPAVNNNVGTLWYTDLIDLTEPFDISAQMYLGSQAPWGADGMAFGLQTVSATASGNLGSSMGFDGIVPSFVVEFDTYQGGFNGDLAEDHIAIMRDGSNDHNSPQNLAGPIQAHSTNAQIDDGTTYDVRFTWDPTINLFSVYFDCTLRLQYTGDIVTDIFGGTTEVFWGFTAATGGLNSLQSVCVKQNVLQSTDTVSVCDGGNTVLTPYITDGSNYVWSPATGLNNANTMSPTATPVSSTLYTVEFDDVCGFTIRDSVYVEVQTAEPEIVFNANTFTLCASQVANIEAVNVLNTVGTVTYAWSNNAATTATNTASPTAGQQETWIYLTVTDDCSSETDSVKLVLGEANIDDIVITSASDCPPNISSNNGAVDVDITPMAGATFELFDGTSTVNNATGDFTGLTGGGYFLTVTDANGCESDSAIIIPTSNNAVTFDGPNNIGDATCFGINDGEATISNVGGGVFGNPYDVTWVHQGGLTINETGLGNGAGDTQDTLAGGSWIVTVTDDGGCSTSETFSIDVPGAVEVDIVSFSDISCFGNQDGSIDMNVSGGTLPLVISWDNGSSTEDLDQIASGSYKVTVTDDNGCFDTATVFIEEPLPLDIDINTVAVRCNGGSNGAMNVVVNEAQGNYTTWNYIVQPGNYTNGLVTDLTAGNYTLQFSDSNGCEATIPFEITEPTPITYTVALNPAYCRANGLYPANGSISASNVSGGVGNYSYILTNGVDSVNTPTWGGIPGGNYTVVVKDSNQCEVVQNVFLDSINPEPNFTIDPAWGVTPVTYEIVHLSDTTSDNNSYTWSLGDWQYSTDNFFYVPDTTIDEPGVYEFCLSVTNIYQCVETLCEEVEVVSTLTVKPPNVFTPNGDGSNDFFHFSVDGAKSFSCTIYTRWGTKIYEWSDASNNAGWDGSNMKGKEMPEGVYYFEYVIEGNDNTIQEGQGHVQLVRH